MYNIAFPNFNIYLNINKIAFSIGDIHIYWYGIIIACAVLICLFLACKNNNKYGIKYSDIENCMLIALPLAILGARLYYVAFSWDYYKNNLSEIIKIWNGGLAIYGGILTAILVIWIYSKKKKIKVLSFLDFLAPIVPLGQAIGRWGNFVNREAYGSVTNSLFRMEILLNSGEYISVHPTFLYESLGLLVIFFFLYFTKRKYEGQKLAWYFILYGVLRFGIEYLRADSLYWGGIKISMLVSAGLIIVGCVLQLCRGVHCTSENLDKRE
ncbi:MAG: prolipoprotein diacylglyceryl transferase [Clostridiales bacterium]|nr:prolipoprotein diacylglyceryl transferase [Clostridiales bacterium]